MAAHLIDPRGGVFFGGGTGASEPCWAVGSTNRRPSGVCWPSRHSFAWRSVKLFSTVSSELFGHRPSGTNRVNRGGSWNNSADNCRSANRNRNAPGNRNSNLGFRLALSSHRAARCGRRTEPAGAQFLQPSRTNQERSRPVPVGDRPDAAAESSGRRDRFIVPMCRGLIVRGNLDGYFPPYSCHRFAESWSIPSRPKGERLEPGIHCSEISFGLF